jgi:peptidoglycan hydrolase-like protein with peptidoglycan-binding domain
VTILTPTAPTLDSRLQVGLRQPRSISHNIRPATGGISIHHGGDAQKIPASASHQNCRHRVQEWQDFHMDGRGWVDLAYNWVVCQHGIVMVGRGWGVRSAANGSNDGNDRYHAVCWLGGGNETPSDHAVNAIVWLIGETRTRGGGRDVRPHRFFFGTTCPGDWLAGQTPFWATATVEDRASAPATPRPATIPAFPLAIGQYFGPRTGGPNSISGAYSHRSDLARWQAKAGRLIADGVYGPRTATRARQVQTAHHLPVDGLIGPKTWRAVWQ